MYFFVCMDALRPVMECIDPYNQLRVGWGGGDKMVMIAQNSQILFLWHIMDPKLHFP